MGLVLLLSVVLVSGCSSLGDVPADSRRTVTPAPVPTTNDDTPTRASGARIAPGLTTDELLDSEALLRNHAIELDNRSYTFQRHVTRRYPNGSIRSTSARIVHYNGTAVRIRYNGTTDRGGNQTVTSIDRWSTDNRTYTAVTRDDDTTYDVSPVVDGKQGTFDASDYSGSLGRILMRLPITVGDPVETNATTIYPLTVSERRDIPPLRNVLFTGYVTNDGVVTEYTLEYEVSNGGVPVRVTIHSSVTLGRTTVERPNWLTDAVNATS